MKNVFVALCVVCVLSFVMAEKMRSTIKCKEPGPMCADCATVVNCFKDGENWDWDIVEVCRLHEGYTCNNGKCSNKYNPKCSKIRN